MRRASFPPWVGGRVRGRRLRASRVSGGAGDAIDRGGGVGGGGGSEGHGILIKESGRW